LTHPSHFSKTCVYFASTTLSFTHIKGNGSYLVVGSPQENELKAPVIKITIIISIEQAIILSICILNIAGKHTYRETASTEIDCIHVDINEMRSLIGQIWDCAARSDGTGYKKAPGFISRLTKII
jgi:hypothetical protein